MPTVSTDLQEIALNAEPSVTDKMAALYMVSVQKRETIERLQADLYEASLDVLANWESGDLAGAVNSLRIATEELAESYDEEAVIEAGWDRRDDTWCRFAAAGEALHPEHNPANVWVADGVIYCRFAGDAIIQDDFGGMGR